MMEKALPQSVEVSMKEGHWEVLPSSMYSSTSFYQAFVKYEDAPDPSAG
jgi:hypothetical protein